VARDRQRAKQRQAERRARRLAEERGSGRPQPEDAGRGRAAERPPEDSPTGRARAALDDPRDTDGPAALDDPRAAPPAPGIDPSLAVGAPPQDEGRSDRVVEDEPYLDDRYLPDEEHLPEDERFEDEEERFEDEEERFEDEEYLDEDEIAAAEEAESELAGAGEAGYEVRGRRGLEDAEAHKERARIIQFLFAVRAELQRVQWPDRQALTTLTGVVLGFVLIAGGYLGLLDAIFSEIIKAII
jgi:preprotein translocase subunit SecE